MTIQRALLNAITTLRPVSTSANLDAEVLLAFVLHKSKTWLLTNPNHTITSAQAARFRSLIQQRKKGMPVAYLIGHKEFYGLDFVVTKSVLVPRPETELLVESVIHQARELEKKIGAAKLRIADIGTGSGCIAISLAKYLPQSEIFASDISETALNIARKNATTHKLMSRITLLHGNLFSPYARVTKRKPLDIIVANLPYLHKEELANVKHEPRTALYGGKMGIEVIDRLLSRATHYLAPHGAILLEIAPAQAGAIEYAAKQQFPGKTIQIIQDLSKRDRVIGIV
ncbi:MAG: peptide chain release factor N(5)-glutamine methyltransferase [Candidatus Kerfeldbacteria bacterium]|nr:peptide chain release factor N(5)-glutamine methyltransferase [Candidatus Kerfeldbacteria bacterium]